MPHSAESFIDVLHNLRWRFSPTKLEQLLPNVTSVTMDDGLRDSSQKLVNHDCLVIFRHGVEGFLNNMAAKRIHREVQRIAANGFSNLNDLLGGSVLKAALDEEISKTIDHQRVCLSDDGFDNFILLLRGANLELLLQED